MGLFLYMTILEGVLFQGITSNTIFLLKMIELIVWIKKFLALLNRFYDEM